MNHEVIAFIRDLVPSGYPRFGVGADIRRQFADPIDQRSLYHSHNLSAERSALYARPEHCDRRARKGALHLRGNTLSGLIVWATAEPQLLSKI
jgi:hypothetical protein